jgi:glycosyltransferase involved in cell wall biosynthesis
MAAGKPILTTAIGSNIEIATEGRMAMLVPPADAPALAASIALLHGDPALRQRLAAEARRLHSSSYTEDRMLLEYMQVYCELMQQKGLAYHESATIS